MSKTLEKQIENAILSYLNYLPKCYAWKNNTVGIYDKAKGAYRKATGKFNINGVADILGTYDGVLVAIEVKTKTGKPSKDQEQFLNRVKSLGAIAGIARSVDEARGLINEYKDSAERLPE